MSHRVDGGTCSVRSPPHTHAMERRDQYAAAYKQLLIAAPGRLVLSLGQLVVVALGTHYHPRAAQPTTACCCKGIRASVFYSMFSVSFELFFLFFIACFFPPSTKPFFLSLRKQQQFCRIVYLLWPPDTKTHNVSDLVICQNWGNFSPIYQQPQRGGGFDGPHPTLF